MNCLSVFDHFVGLALKGLKRFLAIAEFAQIWYRLRKVNRNVQKPNVITQDLQI